MAITSAKTLRENASIITIVNNSVWYNVTDLQLQGAYQVYGPSGANGFVAVSDFNGEANQIISGTASISSYNPKTLKVLLTSGAPCTLSVVKISNNVKAVSSSTTATIDTITTTSTYTQTGDAVVLIIGAGQAGEAGQYGRGGNGGKSGIFKIFSQSLPGSVPAVIGAGGVSPSGYGGTTSFGSASVLGPEAANGTGGGLGGVGPYATATAGGSDGTPGPGVPLNVTGFGIQAGAGGTGSRFSPYIGVGGGGIYAGGGGGLGYTAPNLTGTTGGGGGGGGVAGSGGVYAPPSGYGAGGAGGAGRIHVLRFT